MKLFQLWKPAVMCFLMLLSSGGSAFAAQEYDLVVYGGTASGVMTAVAAARQGLDVALLEPGEHVGGMATGGLSRTDTGIREVIGGLALEFYYRLGKQYDMGRFNHPTAWFYEPHMGEAVMRDMLAEDHVRVFFKHRLREQEGVAKSANRIQRIIMENGKAFQAKVFADCSYEGDLMAQAGVSYTFGRESTRQYGESLAGVREKTPFHQFTVAINPYDAQGRLLPGISPDGPGETGEGDQRIQAYNFRVIATNVPANRISWPKPPQYDPEDYRLLLRLLTALTEKSGRPPRLHELILIAPIPNGKADFNNMGPVSSDFIGQNYDYPDGDYAARKKIWQAHREYQQGFYYFLANDRRVPAALQEEARQWGLAKDEFPDTDHWPHQLYIREARRMTGDFVLTQKDLQTDRSKVDVIGMGSYNSDSHNVQRFVNAQGFAENEGDMQVVVKPYQLPYRMIVPKRNEAENLLAPVCFSASHVAYSSARMEPQYMILGHAAGVASALAVQNGVPVQDIPVQSLQQILQSQGAVFNYQESEQRQAFNILKHPKSAK